MQQIPVRASETSRFTQQPNGLAFPKRILWVAFAFGADAHSQRRRAAIFPVALNRTWAAFAAQEKGFVKATPFGGGLGRRSLPTSSPR